MRFVDLENTVRIIDHRALNRDEIHLKTQQVRLWINGAFQTEVEVLEEIRTIDSLTRTGSTAVAESDLMYPSLSVVVSRP